MTPSSAAARLRAVAVQAAVASLVSLGFERGFFDKLAALSPTNRADLAHALSADIDVVGDWLDGLVAARLLDHDGARGTYAVPAPLYGALTDARALFALDHAALAIAAARNVSGARVIAGPGDDAARALREARCACAPGDVVAVVDLAAAARVADNADDPLGALVYARSLHRREAQQSGVPGDEILRRCALDAGFTEADAQRFEAGGMCFVVVTARA